MNTESVTEALSAVQVPVEAIEVPRNLDELTEVTQKNKDFLQEFMASLPEKAFGLSIRVIFTLIFFAIGLYVIKLLRKLVKKGMAKAGVEEGAIQFLDSCLKVLLYSILIFTIAVNYGFDAASVVAILGSAGIAIGLSLQGALSNFAGGLLILLLKPFRVGDYIVEDSKGNEGIVTEINIFYTHLRTLENKIVVVPNGTLASSSLTNASRLATRQLDLRVDVGYGADLSKAKAEAEKVIKSCEYVLKDQPVRVFVHELGESAIVLGIRAWCKTEDYWEARWYILENTLHSFNKSGIEIPFTQVDVHMK